ncbi:MAG: 2-oxoacid:acceptor oxidoreductase family protein [Oligoflexales bacterium]|nr:2-oxoacid:acceptor oxidoreductase family protein [Oligoflexales bacterium]
MSNVIEKPKAFFDVFDRKPGGNNQVVHYCPGCGHGRIHKLIAEAMDNLEITDRTIFISPVGCSVFAYYYFNCGNIQSAHGRAPAVATGVSRSNPESIVISYQGDGDLAAIGMSEIIHSANRGENISVFFVNNQIYGMTGGQMAPTTVENQKTATSPRGRNVGIEGYPIKMAEIISTLTAPVYVERVAVSDSKNIMKAKKAIQKALQCQKDKKGFTFVEILSPCPIGWKMDPVDAVKHIEENVKNHFPCQVFKDETDARTPLERISIKYEPEKIIDVLGLHDKKKLFPKDQNFIDNFPPQQLRIAGFGGQGVLMAGSTLGLLAMEHDLNTSWLPSYGPEMRGGTANCHVVISGKETGSPVVEKPNVLIAMNGPSYDEFEPAVAPGGLVILNSSIIQRESRRSDVKVMKVPMNEIAESENIVQASNMVAVTAYLTYTKVMPVDRLIDLIKVNFKKKALIDKNVAVIRKAEEYVKKNYL